MDDIDVLLDRMEANGVGQRMHAFLRELYPICRSITGNGVRKSLELLSREIPLEVYEVPSGTTVFDWTVPNEWNIEDAYVKDGSGRRVIDFQRNNLHVVGYSVPVRSRMTLAELKPHLFSDAEHPEWVPYRTSYYKPQWGFCIAHKDLCTLEDGSYEVCIDSRLEPGALTYGECFLRGELDDEVLISCHICHPSLANDNLSGIVVATEAIRLLCACRELRYSYRFIFIPATIGAIVWLARNESGIRNVKHGLVLSCLGDAGHICYKGSRRGNSEIDRVVENVLRNSGEAFEVLKFTPYGYDERQFCSQGFNLALGCFMRTPNGRFSEYHTSADNPEFVRAECLADSLEKLGEILKTLERNRKYRNLLPKCEPQLGKRGLYGSIGGVKQCREAEMALLWVLNLCDGETDLLDISERSGLCFDRIQKAAAMLELNGLLTLANHTG